ncbi:D-sedoheptulose 7-phosphate isomerase [Pseudonocardia zijingensis]|uniref:D-sedoheptulose 7-phosphate isomerase n=2 Tax=Pseudonocardia zijingensis TaxID=153376 RepID=A0ABN1P164_9PSEU
MTVENVTAHGLVTARARLSDAIAVKQAMLDDGVLEQAVAIAHVVVAALRAGNKIMFFGNGGSSMDAGHLAAELTGRFAYDRPGLAAFSLSDSTAAVTAIGNDYSYAEVFARQVLGLGRPGDVAFGLSTSGSSANVVRGLQAARRAGMVTVALTGADGRQCLAVADHCIRVPSSNTARVQEACLHVGHTICELVEAGMFPRSP